ncbi:MAG TPA: DoxX family protein [Candidatus Eisenbacteria bacterium]|nr:DoxX family protein [Candidatus Eisenbacteria bacterium]
MTAGLLVLRLVLGLTMAAHGAQKVLGWFDGPGLAGFAAHLDRLGVRPGRTWAIVSGAVELGGGLLVAVGLLTPVAALFLAGNLLVAILTAHLARGFWDRDGGYEFPLALLGGLVALSLVGPGAASLDAVIRLSLPEPATWLAIVIVVLLGVIAAAASGRLPAADPPPESIR